MQRFWQASKRILGSSRSIPLFGSSDRGDGQDSGRHYRCWNCGWICNKDRDSLAGYPAGTGTEDYIQYSEIVLNSLNGEDSISASEDSIDNYHVSLKYGEDGVTPETVVHAFKSVISSGCPFCGTTAWLGR